MLIAEYLRGPVLAGNGNEAATVTEVLTALSGVIAVTTAAAPAYPSQNAASAGRTRSGVAEEATAAPPLNPSAG